MPDIVFVILKGILLGVLISLSFGPSSFALIQIGMQKEFKYGIYMSFGVLLSDVVIILVGYFGIAKHWYLEKYRLLVGIIGGLILISYGIFSLFRKIPKQDEQAQLDKKRNFINNLLGPNAGSVTYFLKGFFLTISNIITIVFWIAAIVYINNRVSSSRCILWFFISCCLTIFLFNLIKVFLGTKIKKISNNKFKYIIDKGIGLILLIAGIVLIVIAIYNLEINSFPFS